MQSVIFCIFYKMYNLIIFDHFLVSTNFPTGIHLPTMEVQYFMEGKLHKVRVRRLVPLHNNIAKQSIKYAMKELKNG